MPISTKLRLIARLLLALGSVVLATSAFGGQVPARLPTAVIHDIPVPLQPGAVSLPPTSGSSSAKERWSDFYGGTIVRNVTHPTVQPFLPAPAKATGTAVIVVPGGAFKMLSIDGEGWKVGQWLADHGIAAFVLKYRLNETPADDLGFLNDLKATLTPARPGAPIAGRLKEPRATADALAAIALVRSRSAAWGIDAARIGIIGFSAGAMTALNAVVQATPGAGPAFLGYVYGAMGSVEVPRNAPPLFAAIAMDDDLFPTKGFGIVEAWHSAGRPVEVHGYARGGHGFGMGRPGTTTTGIMDQFLAWLSASSLLTASAAGAPKPD